MEADAPALGQLDKVVGLDKTKARVELSSIGSVPEVVPMKADSTLKTVHILVTTIAGVVVIIGGILGVALYITDRIDRLETTMDMRINRLEDNLNKRIVESENRTTDRADRLENNLNKRIVESENRTTESIRETTRGIERLEDVLISRSEQDVSLVAPVSGAVESPLTSEIMP